MLPQPARRGAPIERQALLKEIAQLRMYAEAKRWTESPGLKPVDVDHDEN